MVYGGVIQITDMVQAISHSHRGKTMVKLTIGSQWSKAEAGVGGNAYNGARLDHREAEKLAKARLARQQAKIKPNKAHLVCRKACDDDVPPTYSSKDDILCGVGRGVRSSADKLARMQRPTADPDLVWNGERWVEFQKLPLEVVKAGKSASSHVAAMPKTAKPRPSSPFKRERRQPVVVKI